MIFRDRETKAPLDEDDTIADRLERILGSDPSVIMVEAAKRQRRDGNMNPFVQVNGVWADALCRSFRSGVNSANMFDLRNAVFAQEHIFVRCPIPGCTLEDFLDVVHCHARRIEDQRWRDLVMEHPGWAYHPNTDIAESFRWASGLCAEEINGILVMESLK